MGFVLVLGLQLCLVCPYRSTGTGTMTIPQATGRTGTGCPYSTQPTLIIDFLDVAPKQRQSYLKCCCFPSIARLCKTRLVLSLLGMMPFCISVRMSACLGCDGSSPFHNNILIGLHGTYYSDLTKEFETKTKFTFNPH